MSVGVVNTLGNLVGAVAPCGELDLSGSPPEGWGFVYLLLFPSGKGYVGQTRFSVKSRFRQHVYGKHSCYCVRGALQKYGAESVKIYILVAAAAPELDALEAYYIDRYQTVRPGGYNLVSGGHSNGRHSPSTIEKMRAAHLGKRFTPEHCAKIGAARLGTKRTAVTIQRMRESQLGRAVSPETRAKIARASTGRKHSAEVRRRIGDGQRGRPVSLETREKIRAAKIGRKLTPEVIAKLRGPREKRPRTEKQKARLQALHQSRIGTHHTEEAKARIRAAHAGGRRKVVEIITGDPR